MASVIPGYNYDIFISYRQNDNKYDGWVTEFVDNLNKELEANIKDKLSVYFDINPHDGLLETHSVDQSLENKLRCLIFIPIVSRTYCDTKSFAWQNEFCVFNKLAKEDQFGRDIKLASGNIASRILPVKIHDLDPEDNYILEKELGGVLRSLEFIYKSSGVNRPLRAREDHAQDNLNKTYYRDQINKVANAIKDIISSIQHFHQQQDKVTQEVSKTVTTSQKSKKTPLIITSIATLVIFILGILFIPKLFKPSEQHEKSIAILPFRNDTPIDSNKYFIDGIMEEILLNLQALKELRVLSRTSVEQYRNTTKSITEIAKELGVNYIVEGSGQKVGNNYRLRIQLIRTQGKEAHVWGDSYEQEIRNTNDIFSVQIQIAEAIATELKAVISPEERQIIERVPTASLSAYDFYQQGIVEGRKFSRSDTSTIVFFDRANELFKKALEYDPSFAQAYVGMAQLNANRYYWETYTSESFLDSVEVLLDKALSIDSKLSSAYSERGYILAQKGLHKQAIEDYDKAIQYNLNDYQTYLRMAASLKFLGDFVQSIKNYHEAIKRYSGENLPDYLRSLALAYLDMGFSEQSKYYYQEALKLDGDSARFLVRLAWMEFNLENFEEGLNMAKEAMRIDTTRHIIEPDHYYYVPSKYKYEAYLNAIKFAESRENYGVLPVGYYYRIGYAFWQVGKQEEANYYFNQEIEVGEARIKLGRRTASAYYEVAASYAFLGEKEKAYAYLEGFDKMNTYYPLWWVVIIKHDPFFDSFRNEERFQKIQNSIEAKYQAEHERVRKWLEENNML